MSVRPAFPAEMRRIPIAHLHLDPENPRLPESLQGRPEAEILAYMVRDEALTELAESFADNGYFEHEPLLVTRRPASRESFVVLEGNRRLATLLILLERPVAKKESLSVELSPAKRVDLETVPCRVVGDRHEVATYIGYRHIGGMKKWPAEAKARYVVDQIDQLAGRGDREPFKTLGRRVGSNARPMRQSYAALQLVRHARDEGDFDLQQLLDERRFGVWLRAYASPQIRRYVGYEREDEGEPMEYTRIRAALKRVNVSKLVEVLRDFVPRDGLPEVMDDSRDLSVYAAVLTNERAREVLRKRRNLDEARLLVADEALAVKIDRLGRNAENLLMDVHKARLEEELRNATLRLLEAAKALRTAAMREDV